MFFDCNARKTENNSKKTNHLTDDPKIIIVQKMLKTSKSIGVEFSNADVQS
jgi:hypothetical protein